MKLEIFYWDNGLKKQTSKDQGIQNSLTPAISVLESVLLTFLKKNPHFKGVKSVTLALTLCGKIKIKRLNRDYRKKDKVTDVLSFGVYDNLRPDKKNKEKALAHMDLGDIVICKEKAFSQAREFEITYEQEIIHLAIHGFLHLLGFDHEVSSKEEKIMESFENDLVGRVYKKLANRKIKGMKKQNE